MRQLFIIHGAIRRASTGEWTRRLADHFNARHYNTYIYFWSGFPFSRFIDIAAAGFVDYYNSNCRSSSDVFLYAKSMGADIANRAYARLSTKPSRVIFNSPAFSSARNIVIPEDDLLTLRLEEDRFVKLWSKLGVVSPVRVPSRELVIGSEPGMDHHQVNWDADVRLHGREPVSLYSIYSGWFEQSGDGVARITNSRNRSIEPSPSPYSSPAAGSESGEA